MPIFLFCKYMEMIAKNRTELQCLLLSNLQNYKGLGRWLAQLIEHLLFKKEDPSVNPSIYRKPGHVQLRR